MQCKGSTFYLYGKILKKKEVLFLWSQEISLPLSLIHNQIIYYEDNAFSTDE
jgi:hypothetical protein